MAYSVLVLMLRGMNILPIETEHKIKKSEILKKNIFLKAIELFAEKGFENVKITDICESLKISTGSFYYYYPSKEAVFLEYTAAADDLMDSFVENMVYSSQADRLKQLVMQKVQMFSSVGQKMSNTCMTAFLKHKDASSMDIGRRAYVEFEKALNDGIASGEFRSSIDTKMLTSTLRYIVAGLTMRWVSSYEPFDIDSALAEHLDYIIDSIKENK